jgi:hypothetical protein
MPDRSSGHERAIVTVDTMFDELEAQLRELRISLGSDVDSVPARVPAAPPAPAAPAESAESAESMESEAAVERAELSTSIPDVSHESLSFDEDVADSPRAEARGRTARRGLGVDLIVIAAGWSTLIVLVVRALGQAS